MTNRTLYEFLESRLAQKRAQDAGAEMHRRLQRIMIRDNSPAPGPDDARADGKAKDDADLIGKIREHGLQRFFGPDSRAEVPIAGLIGGRFVSRRIDRMVCADAPGGADTPAIEFLDFKTDADKAARRDKYASQMAEYSRLLSAAFPGRAIRGYILWLHDWTLEKFADPDSK
jgi:ATP-dependent helicase/nuclease subunit A